MKSIKTLVADIRSRLVSHKPFDKADVEAFGVNLAKKLANRLSDEKSRPTLRLSNLGTKCERKLWYSVKKPELSEPLPPSARLKFLYGDILEEFLLFLARASGHTVEQEQAEVNLYGVKGHIDGIIDGELVDCKSASPFGFKKFKEHGLEASDDFGYLTQIDGYLTAGKELPELKNDKQAHFLAVDKNLGHIVLDTYPKKDVNYEALVEQKKAVLEREQPPNRGYSDVPDGVSGNRKLNVACSYCPFKFSCWPGLRVFSYARGPVFLSKIVREPNVEELKANQYAEE